MKLLARIADFLRSNPALRLELEFRRAGLVLDEAREKTRTRDIGAVRRDRRAVVHASLRARFGGAVR